MSKYSPFHSSKEHLESSKSSSKSTFRIKLYQQYSTYEAYAYDAVVLNFIFKFQLNYTHKLDALYVSFPTGSFRNVTNRLKAMGIAYTSYTQNKCLKYIFTPTHNRYSDYIQLSNKNLEKNYSSYSKILNQLKTNSPKNTSDKVTKNNLQQNKLSSFPRMTNPDLIVEINDIVEIVYNDSVKPIKVKICDHSSDITEIKPDSPLGQALLGKHAETEFVHKSDNGTFVSGIILNIYK